MNDINVGLVNSHAPYQVTKDKEQGYYRFTSSAGVEFLVGFDKDDILLRQHSYQLIIANVNHKPSPRDSRVKHYKRYNRGILPSKQRHCVVL